METQEKCFWANISERESWKIPEMKLPPISMGRVVYKVSRPNLKIDVLIIDFENKILRTTVTPRDQYKCGDRVCFLSSGYIVPKIKQFDFLKPRNYRVKKAKFQGYVSEGIVIDPIGMFECFSECAWGCQEQCCFFRDYETILASAGIKKIKPQQPRIKGKKYTVTKLLETRRWVDKYLKELHPEIRKTFWIDVLVKKYERHINALKNYYTKALEEAL